MTCGEANLTSPRLLCRHGWCVSVKHHLSQFLLTSMVGVKMVLLGLVVVVVVASAAAAAQASVTIYNPVGLVLDAVVGDGNVTVDMEMVALNITQAQQDIQFKLADGEVVEVHVQDGDILVLIPDPNDPLHAVQAFKIQVGGAELLTPPLPSPSASLPQEEIIDAAFP